MIVTQTPRLILRHLNLQDADFLLDLMNQPSYHRFIGDRGLRDTAGAEAYIQKRFIQSYEQQGYGLYAVVVQGEKKPAGICGLASRNSLPGPDLGFAFLPNFWSKGFAREAAGAILEHARNDLRLERLFAITIVENRASIRLLEKVGFQYEKTITLPDDPEPLRLYVCSLIQGAT